MRKNDLEIYIRSAKSDSKYGKTGKKKFAPVAKGRPSVLEISKFKAATNCENNFYFFHLGLNY